MTLLFILILAFILRLIAINQSLWLDEAILANAVSSLSLKQLFTTYLPTDFNPPLIYLIEWFWVRLAGVSEIAIRLPSVVFGLLTIYFLYKLAGKLPALLLATSGLHLYYSQEARMYSLAALAVTASFYYLKRSRNLYIFWLLVALYTHYLTFFIIPVHYILSRKFKPVMIALLLYLPWLPTLLSQVTAGTKASATSWGQVVGGTSLKQLALVPVKFLLGRISFESNFIYALAVLVPTICLIYLIKVSKFNFKKNLTPILWLFVPMILIYLFSFWLPVLAYFRLLFLLPAFYWLISIVISRKKVIAVFFVVFNLFTCGWYLSNSRFHREDWQSLTSVINLDPLPVAAINAVNAPLKYYLSEETIALDDLETIGKYDEFWAVPYSQAIFDPTGTSTKAILSSGYQPILVQNFTGDLTLIKYKRLI